MNQELHSLALATRDLVEAQQQGRLEPLLTQWFAAGDQDGLAAAT